MYMQVDYELIDKVGLTAAALYALIKSRWMLSQQHADSWTDSHGVYCRYSRKDMCAALHKSRPTITKAMRALVKAGLIIEKRVGLTAVNKIYLTAAAALKAANVIAKKANRTVKAAAAGARSAVTALKEKCVAQARNDVSAGYTRPQKDYSKHSQAATRHDYQQHHYAAGELDKLVLTDIMALSD